MGHKSKDIDQKYKEIDHKYQRCNYCGVDDSKIYVEPTVRLYNICECGPRKNMYHKECFVKKYTHMIGYDFNTPLIFQLLFGRPRCPKCNVTYKVEDDLFLHAFAFMSVSMIIGEIYIMGLDKIFGPTIDYYLRYLLVCLIYSIFVGDLAKIHAIFRCLHIEIIGIIITCATFHMFPNELFDFVAIPLKVANADRYDFRIIMALAKLFVYMMYTAFMCVMFCSLQTIRFNRGIYSIDNRDFYELGKRYQGDMRIRKNVLGIFDLLAMNWEYYSSSSFIKKLKRKSST